MSALFLSATVAHESHRLQGPAPMRRVLPTQGSQLLWGLVLQSVPEYVRGQKSSDEAPSTGKRASTDERASEKHLRRLSLNFAPKTDGWPRPTGAQAPARHRSPSSSARG